MRAWREFRQQAALLVKKSTEATVALQRKHRASPLLRALVPPRSQEAALQVSALLPFLEKTKRSPGALAGSRASPPRQTEHTPNGESRVKGVKADLDSYDRIHPIKEPYLYSIAVYPLSCMSVSIGRTKPFKSIQGAQSAAKWLSWHRGY